MKTVDSGLLDDLQCSTKSLAYCSEDDDTTMRWKMLPQDQASSSTKGLIILLAGRKCYLRSRERKIKTVEKASMAASLSPS